MIKAKIGIIGGSGFYELMKNAKQITVNTPYGAPSDNISIGLIHGRQAAFLPRHGKKHQYPPHNIPYRANLYALKKLGCEYVIAPTACGSLTPQVKPGDFVFCDQFVDRTVGRRDTYFDGPKTVHVSTAEPYCPMLRKIAYENCQKCNLRAHEKGTVVVINGPRFSTKAESIWFQSQGWQVINMTQYPEAVLARELNLCYLNISLITDYDAGLIGVKGVEPVTFGEVRKIFCNNIEKVIKLIKQVIRELPEKRTCYCQHALDKAKVN